MPTKEFQNKVCKANKSRNTTLKYGYATRDFCKYIRSIIDIEDSLLRRILKDLNAGIAECILSGKTVKIPHLGALELRKFNKNIKIEDGKVKTNLPVDWKATLDLWENDKKAYEDKVLIRINVPYIYRVYYIHSLSKFNNIFYIKFKLNRSLKRALTSKIENKEIDAFLLN